MWRDVAGYAGLYQVSDFGLIRSVARLEINKHGRKRRLKEKRRKQHINRDGYAIVRLCKNSEYKTLYVHRLVALAFCIRQDGQDFVNHKDGNKTNNNHQNLEWCSRQENIEHAMTMGLTKGAAGSANPRARITEKDARDIRKKRMNGMTLRELAEEYGYKNESAVCSIIKGRTWSHV